MLPGIFHGTLARPADWTFYASVTTPDQAHVAHRRISCGGVVIAPRVVLTASHCALQGPGKLAVAVGTGGDPHRGGTVRGVRKVVLAPDADPDRFVHDVAVLVLDGPVPPSVHPVPVATPAQDAVLLRAGARVEVAGVGQTDNVDPRSPAASELRSAQMIVTPPPACRVEVENASRSHMLSDEFCTNGVPGTDRHALRVGDPCYGDSGGPIVAREPAGPVLVGLVSTGSAQCSGGADIQPRLAAFRAFLAPYLPPRSPAALPAARLRRSQQAGISVMGVLAALLAGALLLVRLRRTSVGRA